MSEADDLFTSMSEWCAPLLVMSGGEPLVRKDIMELIAHAGERGLSVALATNGTLVNDRIALALRRAGVRRVSVSLDGACAATHDRVRGLTGCFDLALRGLKALRSAGVSTQINKTVCRRNMSERDSLFLLAEREGVQAIHMFIFVPVGCGLLYERDQALSAEEREELLRWFRVHAGGAGREVRLTCSPQYLRLASESRRSLPGKASGCLAGKGICFVSHSGDVFPCGYLPIRAGSIREKPLMDIWGESNILVSLRNPERLGPPCGECDIRNACGGCRARAYADTGDYMAGDTSCLNPKFQISKANKSQTPHPK